MIKPDGSGFREITSGVNNDGFPSYAPDGKRFVYRSLKRLTNPGTDDSHGTWSPDGEWIAFASARMGFKDEALNTDSPQPYGEIFVMRYDGTRVQQLTDNQWEPAWLPRNRTTQR